MNRTVFHNPTELMQNIAQVTSFLRKKITAAGGDPFRETLNLIPTTDDAWFFVDERGEFWRAFLFISDASCYDAVTDPKLFYETGNAFGRFQQMLSDFPSASLFETIPDFHNTPLRYQALLQAAQADPKGRLKNVSDEMAFFLDHADDYGVAERMKASGELPLRVTHNDTKLNNIMIDDKTGEGSASSTWTPLCRDCRSLTSAIPSASARIRLLRANRMSRRCLFPFLSLRAIQRAFSQAAQAL